MTYSGGPERPASSTRLAGVVLGSVAGEALATFAAVYFQIPLQQHRIIDGGIGFLVGGALGGLAGAFIETKIYERRHRPQQ